MEISLECLFLYAQDEDQMRLTIIPNSRSFDCRGLAASDIVAIHVNAEYKQTVLVNLGVLGIVGSAGGRFD